MFESFYGLSANPFRLSADERFRFAHRAYAKAWSYLKYALERGEGFVLITGRPGTGKTTLIRDILSELDESKIVAVNLVTNQLQSEELLRMVALKLGFDAQNYNKATLLTKIGDYAKQQCAAGRHVVIIVDEAQNLTDNGMEELRLISNLQVDNQSLFQIFLIGQEELRSLIYGQGLENIRQRIVASCRVEPMDVHQTEGYIAHRLGVAGWKRDPEIEEGIYPLVQQLTHGVPREVNHIVGRLLLYGALEEKHRLTEEDLWVVVMELNQEKRMGFDLEEDLETFKRQRGLDSKGKTSVQDAPQQHRDAVEAETMEGASATPDSGLADEAEDVFESLIEQVGEEKTKEAEVECDGFHAADVLLNEQNAVDDSKTIFGIHDVYVDNAESPSELPQIELTRRFDPEELKHNHLFTDVDDLLDSQHGFMWGLNRVWRWLFYPIAITVFLWMILMPRPNEFVTYWEDVWSEFQQNYLTVGGKLDERDVPIAARPEDAVTVADANDASQPEAEQTPIAAVIPTTSQPGEQAQTQTPIPVEPQTPPPTAGATSVTSVDEMPKPGDGQVAYNHVYHISVDEDRQELAEQSRPLFISALEMLRSNQKALLVVTGITASGDTSLVGMRAALREASVVATLFVEAGVERERISMEGARPADGTERVSRNSDGSQKTNLMTVRFRVVRAPPDT
jgi:type II secretory pathway predicted ATPase ExeA